MSIKRVYIILIAAIALSILSFTMLYMQNVFQKLQNNTIGKAVLPDFIDYDIKTIKILKPDGRTTTLRKNKNNEWVVVNCFDYPAAPQKINAFLEELSSMKIIQNIYSSQSGLSELKLLSPQSKDKNSGSEIAIFDDNDKIIFSIIVGIKRTDIIGERQITRGRYMYINGTNHIFLTEDPLDEINYKTKAWLNNKFVIIKNIKTINLYKNDKEIWSITRADINSKFVPAGKKVNDDYNAGNIDKIISSLESLKFETIANPSLTDAYTGINTPYIIKVESFDKQMWQLYIGSQVKNARYVRVKHTDNSENLKNGNNSCGKWIYLVNKNRIAPLIQSHKELFEKEKKKPGLIDKLYSSPIS